MKSNQINYIYKNPIKLIKMLKIELKLLKSNQINHNSRKSNQVNCNSKKINQINTEVNSINYINYHYKFNCDLIRISNCLFIPKWELIELN